METFKLVGEVLQDSTQKGSPFFPFSPSFFFLLFCFAMRHLGEEQQSDDLLSFFFFFFFFYASSPSFR